MQISKSILAAVAASALFVGCAGTDFKRPDAGTLVVGQAHAGDVERVMGKPRSNGEATINGQQVKQLNYAYANVGGETLHPGVTGARGMTFATWNDLLVSENFTSSFKADGTDFDESKVQSIAKGKSTKDEVIAMLGKPGGNAIYPIAKTQGNTALIYSYNQVTGSAFNMKFYNKSLTVEFDPQNVVADVTYTATGNK